MQKTFLKNCTSIILIEMEVGLIRIEVLLVPFYLFCPEVHSENCLVGVVGSRGSTGELAEQGVCV